MVVRHREEVLNTALAGCIAHYGVDADPETILQSGKIKPDVIALFRGLRCAIEGKIGEHAQSKAEAASDARTRIEQGVAHLAIAVVYPAHLRSTEFPQLPAALNAAQLDFSVLTEAGDSDWNAGGIGEILAELRRAHDVLVRDDVLQTAVATLNLGLREVADALLMNRGACDRLVRVLGVGTKSNAARSV